MGARTTALTALIATRRQGAWSDGILKEYVQRDRLDRRDAALCLHSVCYEWKKATFEEVKEEIR